MTIILSATCDISGTQQIRSDQPGTRQFERGLSQFPELRFYTFPGG